ncbi:hypothetical protein Pint_35283 [Pistacia integerrima]|uniref:Uncharacterized protein n=1 Tax=Pistacia integerrima TaxID=434235 RepID=A0ACC0Y3I5_9ROSI|nr:hypothetical protein Pint_35283 [Pistacia integerrima]
MEKSNVPHVLFLPFPAQGHIKPMLSLAELLSHAGFQATFINTDHNYDRLLHNSDISSFHNRFPKFQFISIPDGINQTEVDDSGLLSVGVRTLRHAFHLSVNSGADCRVPCSAVGLQYQALTNLELLLSRAGFQVTFVNSDHNHDPLLHNTDISAFCNRFPQVSVQVYICDGLPPDHLRSGLYDKNLLFFNRVVFKLALCELLNSLKEEKGPFQLPTCVIADGNMCFAIDVAEEFEIPSITFRTHLSKLVEEGEVPFGGEYCYYFIIIIYMSL